MLELCWCEGWDVRKGKNSIILCLLEICLFVDMYLWAKCFSSSLFSLLFFTLFHFSTLILSVLGTAIALCYFFFFFLLIWDRKARRDWSEKCFFSARMKLWWCCFPWKVGPYYGEGSEHILPWLIFASLSRTRRGPFSSLYPQNPLGFSKGNAHESVESLLRL